MDNMAQKTKRLMRKKIRPTAEIDETNKEKEVVQLSYAEVRRSMQKEEGGCKKKAETRVVTSHNPLEKIDRRKTLNIQSTDSLKELKRNERRSKRPLEKIIDNPSLEKSTNEKRNSKKRP